MKTVLLKFIKDGRGATAIDYALIASLISAALIARSMTLGNAINSTMDSAAQHLTNSQ